MDHCTKEQLNSVDESDRTVLHIAAIHKLPKITEILVSEEKMDVLKVDFRKRTALHYGTENGAISLIPNRSWLKLLNAIFE